MKVYDELSIFQQHLPYENLVWAIAICAKHLGKFEWDQVNDIENNHDFLRQTWLLWK